MTAPIPYGPGHDENFAAEAYKACLYGKADRRQQMSVASSLILANAAKGRLLDRIVLLEAALKEAIELLDDCEISHPLRWEDALRPA